MQEDGRERGKVHSLFKEKLQKLSATH